MLMCPTEPSVEILECGIHSLWPVTIRIGLLPVGTNLATTSDLGGHELYLSVVRLWHSCLQQYALDQGAISSAIILRDEHPRWMRAGCRRLMNNSWGCYHGILVLAANIRRPVTRRSAQIQVFDPRAGAAVVYYAGLPFGRPLVLEPQTGAYVIFPSILRFSVSPLEMDDEILLLETRIGRSSDQ